MNFRPELAEKVMAGTKTVTRRQMSDNALSPWWTGACTLKAGRDYAICPGRGKKAIGRVRVLAVTESVLGDVDDHEAHKEGFRNRQEFVDGWTRINGSFNPNERVWRIAFEVAA